MKEKIKNLERDKEGRFLNTLRNKDIMEGILDKYNHKIKDVFESNYRELFLEYTKAQLFDPHETYHLTKEAATKAMELANLIDEYDRKYLEEKKNKPMKENENK